jgi:hypothetical protein
MRQQQQHRQLPALSDRRLRRLRLRIPLEILAVRADVPMASLSRFERGEGTLTPAQFQRVEAAMTALEASQHDSGGSDAGTALSSPQKIV